MDTLEQKESDLVKVNIRRRHRKALRRYAAKHDLTLTDALGILIGNPCEHRQPEAISSEGEEDLGHE